MTEQSAAPDSVVSEQPPAADKWPSSWLLGLQLAALWCLGLVRPLFDVVDAEPSFFLARGNTSGDILIFAIGLTLVPPLVLTLIELLVRAVSARAARVVHVLFVVLLAALVALQFVKGPLTGTIAAFAVALTVGALVGWAFWKTAGMRTFLSLITPAPFIFLALFIFASPLTDIIIPANESVASSPGEVTSGNATPVVIVIYDEMPTVTLMNSQTNVDAERFPNFAKLSKTATWYKNNTTLADGTWAGVPAILTGLRPAAVSKQLTAYKQSVYTMLRASHRIKSIEALTPVCPNTICAPKPRDPTGKRLRALYDDLSVVTGKVLLPEQLAAKLPAIGATDGDFAGTSGATDEGKKLRKINPKARFLDSEPIRDVSGAGFVNDNLRQVAELQNSITGKGRPPLYVMHTLIPHVPFRFGPNGEQYKPDGADAPGLTDQTWTKNRYQVNVALQRFLIQAEYSDRVLGSIVTRMKQAGIWDKALFIITADHGISFRPGGSRRPINNQNFPEIANTLLFVKLPGQATGSVNTQPVRSIDIVPTIAQVTKTGEGLKFDGVPLNAKHTDTNIDVRHGRSQTFLYAQFDDMVKRRDQLAREWAGYFPPGRDGLFKIGPNQNLLGRQVASLPSNNGAVSGKIDNSKAYSNLRPGSGISQFYLSGYTSGASAGAPLAAAVNGRIVAVGQTITTPRGVRFGIILPPSSLAVDRAKVQLFSVTGGSTLSLVASAGS